MLSLLKTLNSERQTSLIKKKTSNKPHCQGDLSNLYQTFEGFNSVFLLFVLSWHNTLTALVSGAVKKKNKNLSR